jgi:hypothetical protein
MVAAPIRMHLDGVPSIGGLDEYAVSGTRQNLPDKQIRRRRGSMRFLLLSVCGCIVLASNREWSHVAASDGKAGRQAPVTTKEIPEAWQRKDIADAAPPRSDAGPTYVLAWKKEQGIALFGRRAR